MDVFGHVDAGARGADEMIAGRSERRIEVAGTPVGPNEGFPGLPMMSCPVLVFGTDTFGRHEGEVGRAALAHGATIGRPRGPQGESYAIPVRDAEACPRPVREIGREVEAFLAYASSHPHLVFSITLVGWGRGEHDPRLIAPMFTNAPANCLLPQEFLNILRPSAP